jgi:hypothetical protein
MNQQIQISALFQEFQSEAATQLMQNLMRFTTAINSMNEDQLVAFYQSLELFSESQPKKFLFKTKEQKMIQKIQNFVVGKMRTMVDAQWGGQARSSLISQFQKATGKSMY